MNKKMMEMLACPIDKHFPLEIFESNSKEQIVLEGAIYCSECSRFYPIIEEIPIMLPDELRNKDQDIEFLKRNQSKLPEKIIKQASPWHL
ncbi:MAG: Trm112 family protein, partial [Thaumarchaeota archaeon]|nr:Trm112 family protein [Nitrososphaerota archaeon]